MKVLLVYVMIPEETKFVIIPDASDEDLAILSTTQGLYVNGDELTELQQAAHDVINEKLASGKYNKTGKDGEWKNFIQEETGQCLVGPFDRVYTCGFYL